MRTFQAIIDKNGDVRLNEPIQLDAPRRAIVTILDEMEGASEITLLIEAALAADWNRPAEDEAWSHLQPDR